jgi:DnaD/phage-associated family protein
MEAVDLSGIKNDTVSKMIPEGEEPAAQRPNIFRLYEENIGPLTPLIADALRDAEKDYAEPWVDYAFSEAVKNNARSWNYVETILKRVKADGKITRKEQNNANRGKSVQDVPVSAEDESIALTVLAMQTA